MRALRALFEQVMFQWAADPGRAAAPLGGAAMKGIQHNAGRSCSRVTVIALAFVYRFAPAREPARRHWLTWGSAIAATLLLVMSVRKSRWAAGASLCR
jgi:hypothetical protein